MSDTLNIEALGALPDGKTDAGPVINQAIATLSAQGGGAVYVPSGGTFRIATPIALNASNVSLVGNPGGGSRLLLDTGSDWGSIVVGAQAQQVSLNKISDLYCEVSSTHRGWAIISYVSAWTLVERVYVDNAFNGVAIGNANTTVLRDVNVNATQAGNWCALLYYADPGKRSDVLKLNNVVLQMGGAGQHGFVWTGMACDVDAELVSALGGIGTGFWIGNCIAQSATEFPQYGEFRNCQVDGWNGPAVQISAGSFFRFNGGSYDSIDSNDPNVTVFSATYDPLSVTRGVTLDGAEIATGPGRLVFIDAKSTRILGARIYDGDKAGKNQHPALEIGPNSDDTLIASSHIGYVYGQASSNSYSVQIDRSAQRTILNGNDHRLFGGLGTLNDLSGSAIMGGAYVDYQGNGVKT